MQSCIEDRERRHWQVKGEDAADADVRHSLGRLRFMASAAAAIVLGVGDG